MMNAEVEMMLAVKEMARQLKIANQLKALELKLKFPANVERVDAIVED